ncbi:Nuclear aminoacylation-dependent tRNA export pathway component [Yamadazyma tenuis]|uniref:Protein kinase domain-containing protein n=1 Tax=Candida tenuis (strain ATCC 10573 / BCRC 21748 / CBS 615 / JCM 9827 / NBRC 10315 / NRRL Y-1498 / VKM Y-70) TaxID=590646 RepID=G3B6I8_CANTC|nr:uncharacterized protein CANTEDRAFT_135285 [Yamadazyma tenuis ATCC 10573]EGV63480.1 hypothetical protein CANTEDRAFT_135285 [Yamadazyma tenuis ATCC 10573]WEJ96695.1 Nuclear aminoacylation-dependent tRNA export pathway component [Yamadazyma tenuis]
MDFLSKTLQTLTGSSIPYTLKEEVWHNQIWQLFDAINPKDNSPVSVFQFNGANKQDTYKVLATSSFTNSKLVKYPGLVSIIDYFEVSKEHLYIVTERVKPLSAVLSGSSKDYKVFGINSIANSLEFLNSKCKLVHCNLSVDSVFVSLEGSWKLFGFELMSGVGNMAKNAVSYGRNLIDLPEELVNSQLCNYEASPQTDSYLLGKFIEANVPQWTSPTIKRLTTKFRSRLSLEDFLVKNGPIFDSNIIIRFNEELNDVKVLNSHDKLGFFKHNLAEYLNGDTSVYPEGLIANKLLPELVSQYDQLSRFKPSVNTTPEETTQNQELLSIVLNFILKICMNLPSSEFNTKIVPIIKASFGSNDRSVRLTLLNNLSGYRPMLSNPDLQAIFPKLVVGIQDSNFIIRELTLNAINSIVDVLTDKSVNQDLLKVLAKCQNDPKPSIRTNTIILIIKISGRIYKNSRNNVLITALSKSLKDSFTPCKMAALRGFESLESDFSIDEVCNKILGILATALMDPKSSKVRNESGRLFKVYFNRVESQATNLGDEEDEELEEKEFLAKNGTPNETVKKDVAPGNGGSGSGFGWNLMNKFVSSGVEGQMNNEINKSSSTVNLIATNNSNSARNTPTIASVTHSTEDLTIKDGWNEFDDGWGGVEDEELEKPKPRAAKSTKPVNTRKPISSNRTKTSTLKLGHKEKPVSSLKLNLVDDDQEEGGWGGLDDW